MSLSSNVLRLRLAAGQEIEDVADATRMSYAVVNGIEMGRIVRDDQVAALARHFGVSVAELEGK
jgi:transcriptional regulator with XRE-family HTH domain